MKDDVKQIQNIINKYNSKFLLEFLKTYDIQYYIYANDSLCFKVYYETKIQDDIVLTDYIYLSQPDKILKKLIEFEKIAAFI